MKTLACLVIDDPLIRPNYGYLNYEQLLKEMKVHDFFTEIAFIPWSYKRSNPKTVKLFADNLDNFALCVHGCNHAGREWGGTDFTHLKALAETALWRMESHKRLTCLPYDPVMVFPQGIFSPVAMQALKDVGFFAAFNTDGPDETQSPATMISDFPLFKRRYPKDRELFREDIKKGRPIILVEHHGAFRNGYGELTDTIDWINSLGNIKWTNLLSIAEMYLNKKAAPIGEVRSCIGADYKAVVRRHLSEARDNIPAFEKIYSLLRG